MASIVSQIAVVLVNRVLSGGSVNWPPARRHYHPLYPVMQHGEDSMLFNHLQFVHFVCYF